MKIELEIGKPSPRLISHPPDESAAQHTGSCGHRQVHDSVPFFTFCALHTGSGLSFCGVFSRKLGGILPF